MKILLKFVDKVIVVLTFFATVAASGITTTLLLVWIGSNLTRDVSDAQYWSWSVITTGLTMFVALAIYLLLIRTMKISTEITFLGKFNAFSRDSLKTYLALSILGSAVGLFYFSILNLHYVLYVK